MRPGRRTLRGTGYDHSTNTHRLFLRLSLGGRTRLA